MPRKGFSREASSTGPTRPRAASSRMPWGLAPDPGAATLSAARLAAASAVTRTPACGATCSSAFDTERRFPMP